jgi:hypothetical protein
MATRRSGALEGEPTAAFRARPETCLLRGPALAFADERFASAGLPTESPRLTRFSVLPPALRSVLRNGRAFAIARLRYCLQAIHVNVRAPS